MPTPRNVDLLHLQPSPGTHGALARTCSNQNPPAEAPEYLVSDDVPADVRAREEEVARAQVQGKPENIIDKIVEGKLRAFYEQVCLVNQKFVKDPSQTITQVVKGAGSDLELAWFLRWQVGEW